MAIKGQRPQSDIAASCLRRIKTSIGQCPYKFWVALMLCGLLAFQRASGTYTSGAMKTILGYAASLALCFAVMEIGSPFIRSSLSRRIAGGYMPPSFIHFSIATTILAIAFSGKIAPLLVLQRRPPPTLPLVILIAFWAITSAVNLRRGFSTARFAMSIAGIAIGANIIVLWQWPFRKLDGDMLATIERSLSELDAGRFPYVNHPPPMPYLPVTFLSYWPAHAFGQDLRWMNILITAVTLIATVSLARLVEVRKRGFGGEVEIRVTASQFVLPIMMLHPIWTQYCVNTQYSPTLLAIVLLGFTVLLEAEVSQAILLGIAVASNQMLGALAPVLFAHWSGRFGLYKAMRLGLMSTVILSTIVAPFLAWSPRAFLEIALTSRPRFDEALMAGRFTWLPLCAKLIPHADLIGTVSALAVASWAAYRFRCPESTVACMASGLCVALMFQPVSFAHYFLPAIALASITPGVTAGAEPIEPFEGGARSLRAEEWSPPKPVDRPRCNTSRM